MYASHKQKRARLEQHAHGSEYLGACGRLEEHAQVHMFQNCACAMGYTRPVLFVCLGARAP